MNWKTKCLYLERLIDKIFTAFQINENGDIVIKANNIEIEAEDSCNIVTKSDININAGSLVDIQGTNDINISSNYVDIQGDNVELNGVNGAIIKSTESDITIESESTIDINSKTGSINIVTVDSDININSNSGNTNISNKNEINIKSLYTTVESENTLSLVSTKGDISLNAETDIQIDPIGSVSIQPQGAVIINNIGNRNGSDALSISTAFNPDDIAVIENNVITDKPTRDLIDYYLPIKLDISIAGYSGNPLVYYYVEKTSSAETGKYYQAKYYTDNSVTYVYVKIGSDYSITIV